MKKIPEFTGFSPATFAFLMGLKYNNNREWFEEHREEYQTQLLEPMQGLTIKLIPTIHEIDPAIRVEPASGKNISRIYRDLRFSKDKTPYRTNCWCSFHQARTDSLHTHGFYFDISESHYEFGMGIYAAPPALMALWRKDIEAKSPAFRTAFDAVAAQTVLQQGGACYARSKGQVDPRYQDWYDLKEIYFFCRRPADGSLFNASLVQMLIDAFLPMKPVYEYILQLETRRVGSL